MRTFIKTVLTLALLMTLFTSAHSAVLAEQSWNTIASAEVATLMGEWKCEANSVIGMPGKVVYFLYFMPESFIEKRGEMTETHQCTYSVSGSTITVKYAAGSVRAEYRICLTDAKNMGVYETWANGYGPVESGYVYKN